MAAMDFDYDEMHQMMYDAYHKAAEINQTLIADVGKAFYELADDMELYEPDGSHPTKQGSEIAARTIADVIRAAEHSQ